MVTLRKHDIMIFGVMNGKLLQRIYSRADSGYVESVGLTNVFFT